MKAMRDNLRKNIIEDKAITKRREVLQKHNLIIDSIMKRMDKYGKTPDLLKEFRFIKNMTDDKIVVVNIITFLNK